MSLSEIKKVYGPYPHNDGRKHMIVLYKNGNRRTVSYTKYLMEQKIGREIDADKEIVEYIDGNIHNNDLNNLKIVNKSKNTTSREVVPVIWYSFLYHLSRYAKDCGYGSFSELE